MKHSDKIEQIIRRAGQIVRSACLSQDEIDQKSSARDLVTTYDVAVQKQLFSDLAELFPEAGFFGEEDGSTRPDTPDCFIIDPIDGTTNFTVDYRHSCISVAYARGQEVVYGAVYNPYLDELFTAEVGCGAYLNGKRLHVHDKSLKNSVYIIGSAAYYPELYDETFRLARLVFDNAKDFRRSGSAALDLCYIAASRAGCFYELRLCPWDFAAGALIVKEAGACVSNSNGKPLDLFQKQALVAAAPTAYQDFMRLTANSCTE